MFRDRQDAGRLLAQRLGHLKNARPVVLALPRGGVVVGAEVARALEAPLEALVVRKIPAPHQAELAIGAVTDGARPFVCLNDELIADLGVDNDYIECQTQLQLQEVRARQARYRGGRKAVPIEGRTVIVVDDGIATGATVRAGLMALRESGPSHLVLAVPVAAGEALRQLQPWVNEVVCLSSPMNFTAVGRFYEDFDQTEDDQVINLLTEFGHENEANTVR